VILTFEITITDPAELFLACSRASLFNADIVFETVNPVSVSNWSNSCRARWEDGADILL